MTKPSNAREAMEVIDDQIRWRVTDLMTTSRIRLAQGDEGWAKQLDDLADDIRESLRILRKLVDDNS